MLTLGDADDIYSATRDCCIRYELVSHSKAAEFFKLTSQVLSGLRDEESDSSLKIVRFLKRLRFDFVAFPLTFDHILNLNPRGCETFARSVKQADALYPSIANDLRSLAGFFERMAIEKDECFQQKLSDLLNADSSQLLVFKESRGVQQSLKAIRALGIRSVEAVASQQLRQHFLKEGLLVVGPTRWFPRHIFDAPRAASITCVHFDCVKDIYVPEPVFVGAQLMQDSRFASRGCGPTTTVVAPEVPSLPEAEQVDSEILLPRIDWTRFARHGVHSTDLSELTPARLFRLIDDRILVLEADDSKTHIARPDLDKTVLFISVDEIEKGDFVIIHESGERDYLSVIANGILAEKANGHREAQANWKRRLQEKVQSIGVEESIVQLKKMGCSTANYQNLRNWQSPSNIKTRDKSDFACLLQFSGIENLLEDYWKWMEEIHRAHNAAGRYVLESLMKQLEKADPHQLALTGRLDVKLTQAQASAKAAVRVEDCSPGKIEVPRSMIGELLEPEETPWQS